MNVFVLAIVAVIYVSAIGFLGYLGYRRTHTSADYLVAGRQTHPFVMALSYGAAFISTSAIVGFGGAAAMYGMGILWLVFLNIFIGIFIAFVVLGARTRRMGRRLQAQTFPELLGRRFRSRFLQGASALIIVVFMPLYAAAVLIGAARYLEATLMPGYFEVAVVLFSLVIAVYVVVGGLKGVMYTDALQGSIMFIGMVIMLFYAYGHCGGVFEAHRQLEALPDEVRAEAALLLPQIRDAVPAEVDDAEAVDWFIAAMGRLESAPEGEANADELAPVTAKLATQPELADAPALVNRAVTMQFERDGWRGWARMPAPGSSQFYVLVTSIILGVGIGVIGQPQLAVRFMTVRSTRELNRAVLVGGVFILVMTAVAYIVGNLSNLWFVDETRGGLLSLAKANRNIDSIIPLFVKDALPSWFGVLFMLALLSAAVSTLSSQFHTIGAAIGRDFFEHGLGAGDGRRHTVLVTRVGIIVAILATVVLAFQLPAGIVATATAMFFGLCAAAFIPAYVGGLYWRRMNRAGALASVLTGFGASFLWIMFVQMPKGRLPALMANGLLGRPTVLPDPVLGIQWCWTESIVVALPVSALAAVVVSLLTRPDPKDHIAHCFDGAAPRKRR